MSNRQSVHQPLPHDAATQHVTGQAIYIDDIPVPANTLHLAFGLSKIAAGKIASIDLTEVECAHGVHRVLTADDLPAGNDVSPSAGDEPLLAEGEVHFVGQPIFLVIAEGHHLARRAAARGVVNIVPQTPIFTIDEALSASSRFEDRLCYQKGNPSSEIENARHVVEGQIKIGGQEHFYLEGQAALAMPQENGDMLVYSSTQHPTEVQHKVAEAIGRPMHGVQVQTRRMGGGFGGKESQANAIACACAVAASLTGKPCKMRLDRDDDMITTGKRHDAVIKYRVGFDDNGRINGIEFDQFIRCGWSQDLSLPVSDRAMLHSDNCYNLKTIAVRSERLKTNTQSATAFRGFGGPQGMLGIERVMDHIAFVLKKNPLTVRENNLYPSHETSPCGETFYGMKVNDFVADKIIKELSQNCAYSERRKEVDAWNKSHKCIKRGLSLTPVKFGISFTLTHYNQAGALVNVYQDGSIRINHGGTEMGQGLFIKVAQIAAEAFGQPIDTVRITATDTSKVPNTSPTAASSGSDLNGMAVKIACDEIIDRLIKLVARQHQAQVSEVTFADGVFSVGSESYNFDDVVNSAYLNRVSLSATGHYATPKISWDRIAGKGRPFYYFAYGAAATEVAIDTLTGEHRILRTDILHDAGQSLNPAVDIGQIEGGYVQGAGWLTSEELVWDAQSGRLLTHAPSTYKIPACSDRPRQFNVKLWDKGYNKENVVYRSKAVGEPPFMLAISVLMALSDAVSACGNGSVYPSLNAPATPETVLAAVEIQRGTIQ